MPATRTVMFLCGAMAATIAIHGLRLPDAGCSNLYMIGVSQSWVGDKIQRLEPFVQRSERQPAAMIDLKCPVVCNESETPQILRWQGLAALEAGRSAEAIDLLMQSSRADPENSAIHFDVGTALWAAGRFAEATDEWRVANATGYFVLRAYELDVAPPYSRVELWEQVAAIDPESPEYLLELASVYWAMGDLEGFERTVRRALTLESPPSQRRSFAMGQRFLLGGQLDLAAEQFYAALELDPGFHIARLYLGEVLFRQGRYSDALKAFDTVEKLDPDNPWPALWLGMTYSRLGESSRAMQWFQKAIVLDPLISDRVPDAYR